MYMYSNVQLSMSMQINTHKYMYTNALYIACVWYLAACSAVMSSEGNSEGACTLHAHGDPSIGYPYWSLVTEAGIALQLEIR